MGISFSFVASSSPTLSTSNTFESIKDYAHSLLKLLPEHGETQDSGLHSLYPDKPGPPISSRSGDSDQEANDVSMMNGNANPHEMGKKCQNGKRVPKRSRSRRAEDLRWTELEREKVAEGGLTGCREAVEILTRNPKKSKCGRGLTRQGLTRQH